MKTLIIYDNTGFIFMQTGGTYKIPQGGIQYLEADIPEGKILKGIDTTKTPNVPMFEDMPKTELQLAQERIEALESYVLEKETSVTESLK